ncbi:MAG: hypothetical protein Q7R88_01870 [bacterium]|nr:hypothetical protein [bacterium]
MQVKHVVYRGFYKGVHYALPLLVMEKLPAREKVRVRRKKRV